MSGVGSKGGGRAGQWDTPDSNSQFNATAFLFEQLASLMNIATVVKVIAVTTSDDDAPVGFVDVMPLVKMVDGDNNTYPHGTVPNLPYIRIQGGANAVICDPEVGDLGLAVFADRDISTVKSNKAEAQPGSGRRNDFADGIYIGGLLNGTPQQFVRFNANGIELADKNGNTIEMGSSGIIINGVTFDRTQHVTGAAEVTAVGGHTLTQHTHTQPNDTHGDTEFPTNTPVG